jgi:hypothetical protein
VHRLREIGKQHDHDPHRSDALADLVICEYVERRNTRRCRSGLEEREGRTGTVTVLYPPSMMIDDHARGGIGKDWRPRLFRCVPPPSLAPGATTLYIFVTGHGFIA